MSINIELSTKLSEFDSTIYVCNKPEDVKKLFNDLEFQYISQRIEDKKDIIVINRYTTQHIVVLIRESELTEQLEKTRKHGAKAYTIFNEHNVEVAGVQDLINQQELMQAFLEGFILGSYEFNKYKSSKEEDKTNVSTLKIISNSLNKELIKETENLCNAVFVARDLINEPVITLNSVAFADIAIAKSKKYDFKCTVFGKEEIEKLGMGGLLAINRGSIDPPRFIILEWHPENATNNKPIALVGKGIVFDTGGLSLKTGAGMEDMKYDMSGGAAVLSTFIALASNKINKHIIGFIPVTDNRPDGNAIAPGDVVKMYNGKTVEILNTDAEGRMILADALSYADKFNPELIIDIATLTGSAAVAIGKYAMVSMGNAEKAIFNKLEASGEYVRERQVQFPFYEEYNEQLKSIIADFKNIGGREAGAITAGKFLENFTQSPYIHLDIAGISWSKENEGYITKGARGIGVRLFYHFIKNY